MMPNSYRGEAPIQLGDRTHILWFGWPGIALLKEEIGDNFDVKITQAMATMDLPVIAKVLAIGLRESWPGVTAEDIERLSPPIAPVTAAISLSLRRTFHGNEGVRDEPEAHPPGRLRRALRRMWFWPGTRPLSSPA